jgi:uncharacterized protein YggE
MTDDQHEKAKHDSIDFVETVEEEIEARGVVLQVTVKGSSWFTGEAALTKAAEVAKLVDALRGAGLVEQTISVRSIALQQTSGVIGKSSSASYTLKIKCDNLELLPEVLGAITGAKNVTLDSMQWTYGDMSEKEAEWAAKAVEQANRKAARIAQAMQCDLDGLSQCSVASLDLAVPMRGFGRPSEDYEPSARMSRTVNIGTSLVHTKMAGVRLTLRYRVAKRI